MADYSDKALTVIKENTSALREFNRLKKYELKSKAEAWVSPGELKLRTVWKSESQVIKARERGSVHFKISSSGERDRHLYDLASVNDLFLDKSYNSGEMLDGSWSDTSIDSVLHKTNVTSPETQAEQINEIVEPTSLPQWVFLSEFKERTVFKTEHFIKFARDSGFVSFEVRKTAHKLHYRYDMATINEMFLDGSKNHKSKPFFSAKEPEHMNSIDTDNPYNYKRWNTIR